MIAVLKNLYDYRELMGTLAWKNIALRYKQAYLGIAWAILKPVTLMLIFKLHEELPFLFLTQRGSCNGPWR